MEMLELLVGVNEFVEGGESAAAEILGGDDNDELEG